MTKTTLHSIAIDFINSKPIGTKFKSAEFIAPLRDFRAISPKVNTYDRFCNDYRTLTALTYAKIIKRIKHGHYEIIAHTKPGFTRTMLEVLGNHRDSWAYEISAIGNGHRENKIIEKNPSGFKLHHSTIIYYYNRRTHQNEPTIIVNKTILPETREYYKTFIITAELNDETANQQKNENVKKTIAQQLNIKNFPFIIKNEQGQEIYAETSNGYWYIYEYNEQGKEIYYKNSNGYWSKYEYNEQGQEIYYESSYGYWSKYEYNEQGQEIYYENSKGYIIDNRPKTVELTMDEIASKLGIDVNLLKIKK